MMTSVKNTKISFNLFRFILLFFNVFLFTLCWQIFAQDLISGTKSCYASAENRYRCFAARYDGMLERAKERAEQRNTILESQANARLEIEVSPTEIRDLQREEMRKLIEASRKRNVSHRGEKYSLTYGFVLEPRK